MKTRSILILLLVLSFGSIHSAQARTDRYVKLQVNEQKKVSGTQLTVKFVSVLDDSRCPEDANCIWAGNAKIQIKLKKSKGAWKTFELNSNLTEKTVEFAGYKIKLTDLDPKPRTNIRINRHGYTATLSVEKST